jgi:hypothetical protein
VWLCTLRGTVSEGDQRRCCGDDGRIRRNSRDVVDWAGSKLVRQTDFRELRVFRHRL